jgi:hypothetical protein
MLARCRCGKTKKLNRNGKKWTCPQCLRLRAAERDARPLVETSCAGCGRTQKVGPEKITDCVAYTCTHGSCKRNPSFRLPVTPPGQTYEEAFTIGGFTGHKLRAMSLNEWLEELEGTARAQDILVRAKKLINQRD